MSLTDDAKLVVETIGTMRQAPGPLSVLPDGYDEACLRIATAYIELSAELAEHKRRLLEQSAVLNAVRQERDRLCRAWPYCVLPQWISEEGRKAGCE